MMTATEIRDLAIERARYFPRGIGPKGERYYTSMYIGDTLCAGMSDDIAEAVDQCVAKALAAQKAPR